MAVQVASLKLEISRLRRRSDGLEEKLLQEIGVLRQRVDDVEEGFLILKDLLFNEFPSKLTDTDSRIQTLKGAQNNLFTIVDRLVPTDHPISGTIKGGLGVLVDRGGAIPIDRNAAKSMRR